MPVIFECEGDRFDTSDMDEFPTGMAHEPFVYVTPDLRCVFVQTMDRAQGVGVRRADEAEIRRLWERYGIAALLRVLSASTVGEVAANGRADEVG